jgi:hypothetical protein
MHTGAIGREHETCPFPEYISEYSIIIGQEKAQNLSAQRRHYLDAEYDICRD